VAGLGGYTLARRALAPIDHMVDSARSITAARLHDRLPVVNPDDEMGRLATVFNETLGRLEASFEQMHRFTADVSHELRTPLTAIQSVGEVGLREHRDDAAYRRIIGSMLEEVDRLSALVDRLLTLSRAETDSSQAITDVIDLPGLAKDVAAHLSVLAEEKQQRIEIDATSGMHSAGDRLVLRQAVINVVHNAIKFSPIGGTLHIRVAQLGERALIEVRDSGPGIPEAMRPRLFDRFYRGNPPPGDAGGVGLGLSIAKRAVEANRGQLSLETTGPQGTTFRISLPMMLKTSKRAS
jgi:signal transduction histidine kinase